MANFERCSETNVRLWKSDTKPMCGEKRRSRGMLKSKLLLLSILLLAVSCGGQKFLGTKQTRLAAEACPIEQSNCSRTFQGLDSNGNLYSLNTRYSLTRAENGAYLLDGSARLRHEHPVMVNIQYMDLYFVFFEGDTVVHEEKIRIRGGLDEYHEFSRSIRSDASFDSSYWVNFAWRVTE